MGRDRGFTLLELMVVVSIAAILFALAMPGFRTLSLKSSRTQGTTALVSALNLARVEAIARNRSVSVCRRDYFASGDYPVCDLSGAGAWAEGWIVYLPGEGSGTEPGDAASIVAVFDPVGTVAALAEGNSFDIRPSTAGLASLQFQSNGRAAQTASFTFCDTAGRLPDARRVEVAASGRVSIVSLDAAAAALACA